MERCQAKEGVGKAPVKCLDLERSRVSVRIGGLAHERSKKIERKDRRGRHFGQGREWEPGPGRVHETLISQNFRSYSQGATKRQK